MSTYRDERDALRARSESLEQELAAARREVEHFKGDGPAAERLERLTHELAEAEREIGRLRGDVPPRRAPMLFGGAAGSMGVAVLATMWLFGARELTSMPCAHSRAPASIPLIGGDSLTNGADLPPTVAFMVTSPRQRLHRAATVVEVEGAAQIPVGSQCVVDLTPGSVQSVARVACGKLRLYDNLVDLDAEGRWVDAAAAPEGQHPKLNLDLLKGAVEVSDDGVSVWAVKLELAASK